MGDGAMGFFDKYLERRELLPAMVRAVAVMLFAICVFNGQIPLTEKAFQTILLVFLAMAFFVMLTLFIPASQGFLQVMLFLIDASGLAILCFISGGVKSPFLYLAPLLTISAGIRFGTGFALIISIAAAVGPVMANYIAAGRFNPRDVFMWVFTNIACFLFYLRLTETTETQKYVSLYMQLEQQNEQLEQHVRELEEKVVSQTIIDPITGLKNFRYFRLRIAEEIARARRQGYPFSICIMEMEDMSEFEKMYGAKERSMALHKVAARVNDIVRDTDLIGKCMENQVLMLLPMANARQALIPVMRIRKSVSNLMIGPDNRFEVSASFGIVCYPDDVQELGGLLAMANSALQRSREKGKGMVTLGSSLFERRLTP
jgi:diguanylate cyclase (GGDEF)-like protein